MRAGQYAVVDGVEYRAGFDEDGERVRLYVPRDEPQPEGFVWDDGLAGHWSRYVPRSQVQRLFEVETWALVAGRFPVLVEFIGPGNRATIIYNSSYTIGYGPAPEDENGKTIVPPGVLDNPVEKFWDCSCDVGDLSDVRETVREVPLVAPVPVVRVPVDPWAPIPRYPPRPKRPKPRSFH